MWAIALMLWCSIHFITSMEIVVNNSSDSTPITINKSNITTVSTVSDYTINVENNSGVNENITVTLPMSREKPIEGTEFLHFDSKEQIANSLIENKGDSNRTAADNSHVSHKSNVDSEHKAMNDQNKENVLTPSVEDNPRRTKSLRSNIDDLLNVNRQRRALRYKRDSNYENLMALLNYLEANGEELEEQKALPSDNSEYFGKFGDDYSNSYSPVEEENAEPLSFSGQSDYTPNSLQDLINLYTSNKAAETHQPLYSRKADTYFYPQSKLRRSSYYSRVPFGAYTGQRRKKSKIFSENSAYGRWGDFAKRRYPTYDDSDGNEVSRVYSLASLLGDQYYPESYYMSRNKRSVPTKANKAVYWNPM